MVTFRKGNILDSGADVICHQVNCQHKMNSGVAKSIRDKWPKVYESYMKNPAVLGTIQEVPVGKQSVINMFAQENFGYDGRRYTSYDAFWSCLGEIINTVPDGSKLAFPARIGCVRGGANWDVIKTMIIAALGDIFEIEIWDYDVG